MSALTALPAPELISSNSRFTRSLATRFRLLIGQHAYLPLVLHSRTRQSWAATVLFVCSLFPNSWMWCPRRYLHFASPFDSQCEHLCTCLHIYIKQWKWKQHGTSWWEVQSPMTICMHRMFLCHGIGCIHFRNMTNVCSYKRQQWYLISFITDFQSDIIVSLWMKVQ